MKENREQLRIALILYIIALVSGMFLLLFGGTTLLSPDETAVYQTVLALETQGHARIPVEGIQHFGWLHPRSWVSQGQVMVPVGFLGWPWILSLFNIGSSKFLIQSLALAFGATIIPGFYLLLSTILQRRFAILGALVLLSFPPVLLYLNRMLFPNIIILSLVIWSTYIYSVFEEKQKHVYSALIGTFTALITIIRPSEWFWIGPWFLSCYLATKTTLKLGSFLLPILLILGAYSFDQRETYGAFLTAGYFLRDNSIAAINEYNNDSIKQTAFLRFLAFGFHPRHIMYNVWEFILVFLWPWTGAWLMSVGYGFYALWKKRVALSKSEKIVFIGGCIASLLILIYYGNGLYMDHVAKGAIAMGNSFLRYTMPVVAFGIAGALWILARLSFIQQKIVMLCLCALVATGIGYAFGVSDESLLANRVSIQRNDETRERARPFLQSNSIVLSERSDKIFSDWVAVSPMPPLSEVAKLLPATSSTVYFYSRPISQKDLDRWGSQKIRLEELFAHDRFVLYRLYDQR